MDLKSLDYMKKIKVNFLPLKAEIKKSEYTGELFTSFKCHLCKKTILTFCRLPEHSADGRTDADGASELEISSHFFAAIKATLPTSCSAINVGPGLLACQKYVCAANLHGVCLSLHFQLINLELDAICYLEMPARLSPR